MRKHLVWILALAFAASAVGVAYASSANDSTVSMKLNPSKLPKKKFKATALTVETSTIVNGDPGGRKHPTLFPDPTSKTVLLFDNDMQFNTKGVPTCKESQITGTTSSQALAACKKAKIGSGSGEACASDGAGGCITDIPAQILAFNGKPQGGNPVILLWTHNVVTGQLTLPGILTKTNSGDFGWKLSVTVPPLAGGAGSLTDFKTTVSRGDYVAARCKDADKKLNVKATFTYNTNNPPNNGGGPDTVSGSQTCKVA